ncbi:hypothetical protein P1X15_03890 [Runella sp. MFBS21]|nr:hypothetical protein [Runella sp. MFBS21]MDF7816718.1 hypothetical protein [Runella sp. MFBS21]
MNKLEKFVKEINLALINEPSWQTFVDIEYKDSMFFFNGQELVIVQ